MEISYLTSTGKGNVTFTETIPANSRKSYNMSEKLPNGRAAIMVTSKTSGKKIMVERAMYWNSRGAAPTPSGGTQIDPAVVMKRAKGPGGGPFFSAGWQLAEWHGETMLPHGGLMQGRSASIADLCEEWSGRQFRVQVAEVAFTESEVLAAATFQVAFADRDRVDVPDWALRLLDMS